MDGGSRGGGRVVEKVCGGGLGPFWDELRGASIIICFRELGAIICFREIGGHLFQLRSFVSVTRTSDSFSDLLHIGVFTRVGFRAFESMSLLAVVSPATTLRDVAGRCRSAMSCWSSHVAN